METVTRGREEAGFTLVEALVAIVILAFGLIAITNLMIVAASSNNVGNQSTAATAIASEKLELLKALPFTTAAMAAGGNLTMDASVGGIPYFQTVNVDGVGPIHSRWQIVQIAGDNQTRFITVRAEPVGGLLRSRARAEFTTFRSCTSLAAGCPTP